MKLLFLNSERSLEDLSSKIFKSLELGRVPPSDSLNVYKGEYFAQSFLGMKIKIEYNSYDYEDNFQYMMSIREDFTSKLRMDQNDLESLSNILIRTLFLNIGIKLFIENEDDVLKIIDESYFNSM